MGRFRSHLADLALEREALRVGGTGSIHKGYKAMVHGETIGDDPFDGKLTLVSGVNVRDLPIGPMEAFVLSRIDGTTNRADLAVATGLGAEEIEGIVNRLMLLGAIEPVEPRSMVAPSPANARSGSHSIPLASQHQATAELTPEQREQLLDWDARRGSIDHYELLGVPRNADVKSIRAAYYELVRVFHPDRFYGKQLGSFEAPLAHVFPKFTEAYEVLRRPESRAEYDRYVAARDRTLEFDRYIHDSAREPVPSSLPPASGERATRSPSSSQSLRASSMPPSDPEARRRALARKLGHSSQPPRPSAPAMPAINPAQHAADELKRRYEQRVSQARDSQRDHYVQLAHEAEQRNDLVAAANALRVACSLSPDNLELKGDLQELERRAAAGLWEAYLERAKYAAVEGRLAEAAEAYERAAIGHPNASLYERAAYYVLEANGDLRHAAKLGKQAVTMAPNSARNRLTLAQVYAAANLRESALAELERARALEPDQPIIKEWIARVKRGAS